MCSSGTKISPYDNTLCVSCENGQFYNTISNNCEACPPNTVVDPLNFFRCLKCPSNLPFYNLTSQNC